MNPIIRKQLENCRVANVPNFTEETTVLRIPKGSDMTVSPYQVGKYYILELADYIINPPPDFTLASNWNKGSVPTHKYYKCEILQTMGKMVKIIGSGYDIKTNLDANTVWEGWVPQKGIKLIQELK